MADQPSDPTTQTPDPDELAQHQPGEEAPADPSQAIDSTTEAEPADLLDQATTLPDDDAEDYPHQAPGSSGA